MDKLFESSTGLIDFVAIEEEFFQLQDYVTQLQLFTEQRSATIELIKKRNSDNISSLPVDHDIRWRENAEFLAPAMAVVSLYLFTEKCLKNLCYSFTEGSANWYVEEGVKFKVPKKHTESIIEASLRYLNEQVDFNFSISPDVLELLEQNRILRNDFAHGDWENVKRVIGILDIDVMFRKIALLFEQIENGMIES